MTRYTRWYLDYYKDFRKHLDSHYRRIRDNDDYVIFNLSQGMSSEQVPAKAREADNT